MNHLDLSPPHSVEAEQGVLGGLLLDNNAWDLVADKLEYSDFFRHDHRLLFGTIACLADKAIPFDIVTVHDALENPDEAGGLAYLGELAKNTPSVANIEHYAFIVRNRSQLRQLMILGYQCSREATDPQADATEVQESIEQQLFALGEGKSASEFVNINKCLTAVVEQIDEHFNGDVVVTGVPSGLDDLDKMTS
ncbi:DnaB-like helicase N-terminal domain-containing protein, partial [Pseudomonas aeruginosa]|uniref:DnaB-like helicase N-terminal domain-containing protein n=1 Tax=Pseudomonas aeruginosa TaxID=287 RepID=UPI000FF29B56